MALKGDFQVSISFDCCRKSFSSSKLLLLDASEISPFALVWITSAASCNSGQIRCR